MTPPDKTMVLGLDLSLTGTGLATITSRFDDHTAVEVWRETSTGKRDDSITARADRLLDLATRVTDVYGLDMVVVEGPSIMSKGGSNWDRAGLWWLVLQVFHDRTGLPIVVVPPTQVKKFATDRGNADKTAVAVSMARMWPQVSEHGLTDNEWDALALAHMGAQRLGLDVPSRAHHAAVLAKVAWPDTIKEAA